MEHEGPRTRRPTRDPAWFLVAVGVYVIGIAAIVALAYRDLKNGAVDSWPDVLIFAIWALIPWWITAGIAVRLEWGPREIASRFRASRR